MFVFFFHKLSFFYFNVTFIISSGLEFWSVSHTQIQEISELKVFKNINFLAKISNNWPNDLFGTNVYKTLE